MTFYFCPPSDALLSSQNFERQIRIGYASYWPIENLHNFTAAGVFSIGWVSHLVSTIISNQVDGLIADMVKLLAAISHLGASIYDGWKSRMKVTEVGWVWQWQGGSKIREFCGRHVWKAPFPISRRRPQRLPLSNSDHEKCMERPWDWNCRRNLRGKPIFRHDDAE